MAEENTILKLKLKHKGFWSFKDLYEFCYDWFKDNGYDLAEKEYTEKISGNGKSIEIDWEAGKEVTDYFKYQIKMKWMILGLVDDVVEQEGQKVKTNKGEVKINFEAVLVKDYEARWENKPIWKFLRGTYDKYIIKTTAEEYAGRLSADAKELINQVKAFLNLGK